MTTGAAQLNFFFCVLGDGGGYLSGEDGLGGRGGAEAAADRDGGGVLGGGDGIEDAGGGGVLILAGRLAIVIFVLFLACKESNVFFVLISIII